MADSIARTPRKPREPRQEPFTFEVAKNELGRLYRNYEALQFLNDLIAKGEQAENLLIEKDTTLAQLEQEILDLEKEKDAKIQQEQAEAIQRAKNIEEQLTQQYSHARQQLAEAKAELERTQQAAAVAQQKAQSEALALQERAKQNIATLQAQASDEKKIIAELGQERQKIEDDIAIAKDRHLLAERDAQERLQAIRDEIKKVRDRFSSLG